MDPMVRPVASLQESNSERGGADSEEQSENMEGMNRWAAIQPKHCVHRLSKEEIFVVFKCIHDTKL